MIKKGDYVRVEKVIDKSHGIETFQRFEGYVDVTYDGLVNVQVSNGRLAVAIDGLDKIDLVEAPEVFYDVLPGEVYQNKLSGLRYLIVDGSLGVRLVNLKTFEVLNAPISISSKHYISLGGLKP